jgi:hypothetical protein
MALNVIPAVLATASRDPLLTVLAGLAGKPPAAWLPPGHPAADGQLPRTWQGAAAVTDAQRVQAVAIAGPNHCVDGWSYAGRAMSACLAGDMHAARHLSYYAQLRAGLSILANLGVGCFNGINFAITTVGSTTRVDTGGPKRGMGTHDVVWDALKVWASTPATAERFIDMVRLGGAPLRTSLETIWAGPGALTISQSVIQSWGVDLDRGREEHRHRNISSYTPHALTPLASSTAATLDFISQAWEMFEPYSGAGFDNLDRHLLRSMFWTLHDILEPPGTPLAGGEIARYYENLPVTVRQLVSLDFLTGAIEPDLLPLIRSARSTADPAFALSMVARALLLLRIATAFTYTNFKDAGLTTTPGAIAPFFHDLGVARGFWPHASSQPSAGDLWSDVGVALTELLESREPPPAEMNDWSLRGPRGLPTLAEAERIVLWALAG